MLRVDECCLPVLAENMHSYHHYREAKTILVDSTLVTNIGMLNPTQQLIFKKTINNMKMMSKKSKLKCSISNNNNRKTKCKVNSRCKCRMMNRIKSSRIQLLPIILHYQKMTNNNPLPKKKRLLQQRRQ